MSSRRHYVYILTDGENVKYVGYTASLALRQKKHRSSHPDWRFIVVGAYNSREEGFRQERLWMERLFDAGHPLINIAEGGMGGKPGISPSFLTRSRMSAALLGNTHMTGKILPEETKRKISLALTGRITSEVHRRNLSKALLGNTNSRGKVLSEEHRRKLSEAKKGKPGHKPSEETRRKLSLSLIGNKRSLGRVLSEETRRKMSDAGRRAWLLRKERSNESPSRLDLG